MRLSLGLICFALFALAAGSIRGRASAAAARVRRAQYLMGTVLEIEAIGRDGDSVEAAVGSAFAAVARVESRLSNWRADSELSRVNARTGSGPVSLSPRMFASLSAAFDLARETGGAFDPTVGALTEALGLTGKPADPARADAARGRIGWNRCGLDPFSRTISSSVPVVIDSGAFGKGEALDEAVAAVRRAGVFAARLNFGGQISVFGSSSASGRELAAVAVAAPDGSGEELRRFVVGDGSVSTSGDSEKPGHLIDPRTGRAAEFHGSATVIAATGMRADALSTALFVLGPEEGIRFANRHQIPALYVFRSGANWALRSSRFFPEH